MFSTYDGKCCSAGVASDINQGQAASHASEYWATFD